MAVVRTFHPRRGRLSGRHRDALDRLLPVYAVPVVGGELDNAEVFGRDAPLVVEIGSGMGDTTLAMAAADPARNYLAVEIHTPGVANLLAGAHHAGLRNVRVAVGDALDLLRDRVRAGTLDAIHVFFPDPWPKVRHHKRRLIQPRHSPLLSSRLRPGGVLWCATDSASYAAAMRATLAADPLLVAADPRPLPGRRPPTRFEQRAVAAGRAVVDLVHHRR